MANPPAYWASSSVMKEKSFITLTPGINVIKLFLRHWCYRKKLEW